MFFPTALGSTGYPTSSDDALDQYWSNLGYLIEPRVNKMSQALAQKSSSASTAPWASSEAGAPQRRGVSVVGAWAFPSHAGTSQSQDQTGLNMGAYSQSNEYGSEMAAFFQQGDGSEGYDMVELPQGVSEPYPPSFIVQTSNGYKRSRISATSDKYSLNQGPEAFGVNLEKMSGSTKGSDFKM